MTAKLQFHKDAFAVEHTAAAALAAGDPVQLSDGRAAVVAGQQAVASGANCTVYTTGRYKALAASGTTFSIGDWVLWDVSAGLAIPLGLATDGAADFVLGRAIKAKVSGETNVLVDLNATFEPMLPFVYEFDCETGVDSAVHTLIPAVMNKTGLFITHGFGLVSEVFAGSIEDQGIVTIENSSGTDLFTLTAADSGADAVNDYLAGHQSQSKASGTAALVVAAGLGVQGVVTQETSGGSPAGKIKAYVQAIPLV